MKNPLLLLLSLLASGLPGRAQGLDAPALVPGPPTLTAFAPAAGAVGQLVTLSGTGLLGVRAVAFADVPAPQYQVVSATSLTVTVPVGARSGLIRVTTPAGTGASADTFRVLAAPAVRAFSDRVIRQARAQLPAGTTLPAEAWLLELQDSLGAAVDVQAVVAGWTSNQLDAARLNAFMQRAPSRRAVFERLRNATKGLYQQRVVVDDYDQIPGVQKQRYVSNGLRPAVLAAKDFGVDSAGFDLPANNTFTFSERAVLVEIKPGEKLYRVTNDSVSDKYAKTGSYWTRTPPAGLDEVIGGVAVMPEWNNFQRVYEFTAPAYADPVRAWPKFYVWEGPAAAQAVSGVYCDKLDNGYCLPGGKMQVFVPNRLTRSPDFPTHIRDVTARYKSW